MIDMSVTTVLNVAEEMGNLGKRYDGRDAVLILEPRNKGPRLRIQLIDISLSALDNVKDNAKKATLSIEGTRIAGGMGRVDLQAPFLARTADLAMTQVSLWHYRRSMLNLSPP